jgi:hypothetical protein
MLSKSKLKNDLQGIFEDMSNIELPDRLAQIGDAIVAYLGDASVGMPPAGTMSGVTFPGAAAIPNLLRANAPAIQAAMDSGIGGSAAGAIFIVGLVNSVLAGCSASLGGLDGVPISPGVQIVTEIGMPPIVPVILTPFPQDQGATDAATSISDAIHQSITSILFNIIELVPSPAGPVPTPMPPAQIK